MSENDTTDTNTDAISCPADGCEYSGQSVPAVRAHVNSIGDPDHPMWGEIKDDIDTESTGNQTEPSKNQESDSDTDTDSMPTTDEYAQQYSDDSDTDDTDDSNTTDSVSLPNLPMNPTTLLVLLVIGISLYMTYSMVGSGSGTPTAEEATTEDTTPDIDGSAAAQSNDDIQQGLVG